MTTALVEIDDVHVHFAPRKRGLAAARAVDGVSLQLMPGEIVALVGESGCGKTTLARSLLGLVAPTAGTITINGVPLRGKRALRDVRRRTGLIFQDPMGALNPRRTVVQAVTEGLEVHGVDGDHRQMAVEMLNRCGLRPAERFLDLYPHELSGGQRQRVVIAGAMVLRPTLLIADEPVSSLDASVRGEVLALLLDLARTDGVTMMIVTHDLGLAWNIADRVAVMYLGKIVELGTTEALLGPGLHAADPATDPAAPDPGSPLVSHHHPYTEALLAAIPSADRPIAAALGGEPPDPTKIAEGCRFNPRCPSLLGGNAERLGVAALCVTNEPQLLHGCACWVQQVQVGTLGGTAEPTSDR